MSDIFGLAGFAAAQKNTAVLSGNGSTAQKQALQGAIDGAGGDATARGAIFGPAMTAADRWMDSRLRLFEQTAYPALFFDPTAPDDTGDGSIGRPYKNLTAARLAPGRRHLIKAGTTIVTGAGDAQNGWLSIPATGTAKAPIIIGRYGDKSLPNPVINGAAAARVIRGANNAKNWRVRDLEIIGGQAGGTTGRFAISQSTNNATADQDVSFNIVIADCKIHGVTTDGSNDCDGIKLYGADNIILGNEIFDIATDAIWFHGARTIVSGNSIYKVAQDARAAGDCIQCGAQSNGSRVSGNYLDHFEVDIKQCVYFEVTISISDGVIIEDNYCVMADGTAGASAPIVCGATNSIVRRNFCKGGVNGIALGNNTIAHHNVVIQTVGRGIVTGTGCKVYNNTCVQTGNDTTQTFSIGIRCNTPGTLTDVKNNLLIGQYNGITGASGAFVEANNAFAIRGVSDAKVRIDTVVVLPNNPITLNYATVIGTAVDNNYRPLPGSPLIGAGVDSSSTDGLNKDMESSSARNIGAY